MEQCAVLRDSRSHYHKGIKWELAMAWFSSPGHVGPWLAITEQVQGPIASSPPYAITCRCSCDCCHQLSRLKELALLPLPSENNVEGQSSVLRRHPPAGRASLNYQTSPSFVTGRISRQTRCPLESPEGRRKTPLSKYSRWWLEPTRLLDKSNEHILHLVVWKGLIIIWVQQVV